MQSFLKHLVSSHFLYLLTAILLISCTSEDKQQSGEQTETDTEISDEDASTMLTGRYGIESAIVKKSTMTESEIVNSKGTETMWFDDYGNKQRVEQISESTIMGKNIVNKKLTIIVDGYIYDIDMDKKTGTKMAIPDLAGMAGDMDFSKLSKDLMDELHMKDAGTEDFLGRECKVYEMDDPTMNMKGKYWVWKNFSMRVEVNTAGMNVKSMVTSIDENAGIAASMFEVPNDLNIEEVQLPVMAGE